MNKKDCFLQISSNPPSLFSSKEQYQLDHTNRGKSKLMRVCHKSMAHPFRFFSFFQIRN